jgi:ATP/maltotriose-dependent transcriptional regulator MalT
MSADPVPVPAPDAGRAGPDTDKGADQGQVLVLDLGQVKAQLVQSMSDQQLAIAAEDLLVEPLSQREQEVLELIAQGLTNREVAQKLFITTSTVKVHTRNIYGKLDVGNRTQAIAKARTLGILSDT